MSSSSSPTNPSPDSTPSIAELRTWLLDSAIELVSLERRISLRGLPSSSKALSVRLGIISLLLPEMRAGVPLPSHLAATHVKLIEESISRLRAEIAAMPDESPPIVGA